MIKKPSCFFHFQTKIYRLRNITYFLRKLTAVIQSAATPGKRGKQLPSRFRQKKLLEMGAVEVLIGIAL